jgi:hypothetical protein
VRLTNERVGVFLARRSVQHLVVSINKLTLILEIIGQYDVELIETLLIIAITKVLKIATYIITSIVARVILVLISVSTFKTDIIVSVYMIISY